MALTTFPAPVVPYNDIVTVYRPTQTVDPSDLKVVPAAVALVGTLKCYLLRQSADAKAALSSLGIFNVIAAEFYTAVEEFGNVGDRYVLVDAHGQMWVIHGRPVVLRQFDIVDQVKGLATLLRIKPVGVA